MKVLIIHQYFLAPDEPGGSRWNELSGYFARAGHDVTVIAGMVHYSTGKKSPRYKRKFIVREQPEKNVTVWRCHVSESYNRSFLGRFWAYLSFALSAAIAGIACAERADVIIATSPPLTVAIPMWLISVFSARPAIFEVRDLWPESAIDTGVLTSRPLIWLSYRLEELAYRRAAHINVLTPAFERALIRKKHVRPAKISMIPNAADLEMMTPAPRDNHIRRELAIEGKFLVSYFGAHGRANRLGQLLDAAELLKTSDPDVRIMLVGDGMEKPQLLADAERRKLDNIIFIDSKPKSEIADYINASDVCTAVLMKNDTFKTVYPNKVFDYMCCARPIIIAIDGVARELVENAAAGIFTEPENPEDFVRAIEKIKSAPEAAKQMGINGRKFVEEKFSRKQTAQKYLDLINKIHS